MKPDTPLLSRGLSLFSLCGCLFEPLELGGITLVAGNVGICRGAKDTQQPLRQVRQRPGKLAG